MIDSSTRITKSVAAQRNQLVSVSERKLKTNRENSKKSTVPKTLRGKAYSRRNALKHSLFTRQVMDFAAHCEDPDEWTDLLNGLWQQYQPVGKAEELEVERAAICWWKLKRLWRYENATNRVALRDLGRTEMRQQAEYCKTLDKEEAAVILQLQAAMKQIEANGEISQELRQRMFATMPGLEAIWPAIEEGGEEVLSRVLPKNIPESSQERASAAALRTAIVGVYFLKGLAQMREASVREIAVAQHVIPNQEVLDKILRYETTIERNLTRALDRLERLQRHRTGEIVPQTLKVELSR